jgi:hypothetical protein
VDINTFKIGSEAQAYTNIAYRKSPDALKETLHKISENRKLSSGTFQKLI